MNLLKHKKHLTPKGLLLSVGVAWGIVSMGAVLAGTIAQTPLFISSSLDPNILFILDDSGSMEVSYLPESLNTDLNNGKVSFLAIQSAAFNTAYYDPKITYLPPLDQDGKSLGDADFYKAWKDGYASLPAHGGTTVNLSSMFQATWTDANTYLDDPQPAYYYSQNSLNPDCGVLYTDDDCYTKEIVSATSALAGINGYQNFANWYSYYRTRLMMAKAGISRAFARLDTTPRVGYGRINDSTADTIDGVSINTVHRGVRAFSGKDRADFFTWLFAIQPDGDTPLRRALDSAGLYYSNEGPSGPWSSTPGSDSALLACRQSYTILMTDGYWNNAKAATAAARDNNDGSTANNMTIPNPDPTGAPFSYSPASPFKDTYSNTLADIAMYYWKRDLCPSIANEVPFSALDPAFWQHMVTYGIGLGVPTAIVPNTAFSAIGTTGVAIDWPNSHTDVDSPVPEDVSRIDDLLHASVNGRGGFFNANNPPQLTTKLNETLSKITEVNISSASAAAANSTQLNTGTQVYQAKFDPKDWSGKLQAFSVNTTTGALTERREAFAKLPAHADRKIYTYKPSAAAGSRGVLFQWANLTTTPSGTSQRDYLNTLASTNDGNGELRVAWLRGDSTNEKINAGDTNSAHIFRKRTNFLGDIVNSDPVYVGTEDYGYGALSGTEGSSYTSFRASAAYKTRSPMLYVGANDGMLHGFDASGTGGQEVFAYIPNSVFPGLSQLTSPDYVHQYYVDGVSGVGDVYDGTLWHTLLVGTTGAGGRAVFALDVTAPDAFGAGSALWEFTSADDVDLGYTLAQPLVVRLQNGSWVVIVANGYNSDNGHAVLFVLDALTGEVLKKMDTGAGDTANKNGLSSPVAVDTDNDQGVNTIYAGDLYGNLWKFDVSGPTTGSWRIPANKPFFVACTITGTDCDEAHRQPITGKPNVGKAGAAGSDQNGVGLMVYFGTGKYFETGDNAVSGSPQVQTFYGLWDQGSAITDRASLQEQTIDFQGSATLACAATTCPTARTTTTHPIRVVSKNPVCYAASSAAGCSRPFKSGWALNLLNPANSLLTPAKNTAEGERVVSFPLVRRGLVVFATVIPDPDPCKPGGTSWLMEIDALGGGEFGGGAPFDVNDDGQVDDNDLVEVVIIINGTPVTVKRYASGVDLEVGIHKAPAKVESAFGIDFGYVSGSKGMAPPLGERGGAGSGRRLSWRQLR